MWVLFIVHQTIFKMKEIKYMEKMMDIAGGEGELGAKKICQEEKKD